ncbi:hypothetical protein MPTK1_3g23950 [Marchantia polymorpha subsp. ruderalis]|uniref:very-long-chain 3-oxoacyl-CoA synthase n=2 Tax=Marchantia polymorpha TaxID=3197 RepID=A0AAF6B460_MARPO|nr:hypothetical protein MARPO_0121s0029 [Marchantia polymorpha]BBN06794.1 hypothetical protein Mp_3g23950 [Marchantia polymorpha subsp. ruderalis]|eukprot:PTQ30681.1 hypothetical protein MARPO_0121s0029 [Marchantia polymorpha]
MESLRWWLAERPEVSSFRWKQGQTFAASYSVLIGWAVGYLALIYVLRVVVKSRKTPVPLGPIPILHNIVLSVGSLVMFCGCLQASALQIESSKWIWGFKSPWKLVLCFPRGTISAGPVFFWSYIYYLSKFYELIDTVVLVLRKRPLTFLHVFHHVTVIFMSFFWLEYAMSLQIVALLTNTGVHVVMYTYYLLCSIGKPPAWKKLVTNLQILQFVFSFVASMGTLWYHFTGAGCSGMGAWVFNAVFNALLLALFLNFHNRQYKKGVRSEGKRRGID